MDNEELYIRICKEHRDLIVRIEKLEEYINKYNFQSHKITDIQTLKDYDFFIQLSSRHSGKSFTIMIEQYASMIVYLSTLEQRMALMNIDIIQNDFSITYKFLGKILPCKKEVK